MAQSPLFRRLSEQARQLGTDALDSYHEHGSVGGAWDALSGQLLDRTHTSIEDDWDEEMQSGPAYAFAKIADSLGLIRRKEIAPLLELIQIQQQALTDLEARLQILEEGADDEKQN